MMKKIRKKMISGFLCFVLGSSLMAGCNKEEGALDSGKDITAGGQKEEFSGSTNGQKENNPDSSQEDSVKEGGDVQADDPMPTKIEYSDVTFDLLENYREKNVPSWYMEGSEGEAYCNVLLNAKKEIEYYTYNGEADGCHIWKYTLKEKQEEESEEPYFWEKERVSWLESIEGEIDQGRVTIFTGEDQNDYAWYIEKGEISHFMKRKKDASGGFLDSCEEIWLEDWRITEMSKVAVLENGNVATVDLSGTCYIHNQADGSLIEKFRCGYYLTLSVDKNQVYVLDRDNASVRHYDAEQQELKMDIKGSFNQGAGITCQGDNIYVCCSTKGIYCAKEDSREFQQILDAGMYHFAKDGVIIEFFMVGDIFYVAYGEDKAVIKKYFPAEQGDGPANSLTVYSLKRNDVVIDMISEFQAEYPDIEIIYETGEGADGSVTAADHIRALNARILAGDGPDILLLDGLPAESYQKKGILADLNPAISDLKDKLLPNLQEFYREGGKLYMLPLRITMPMFIVSDQVPEGVCSSLEALVEYSEENGEVAFRTSYADILEMLYCNFTPDLVTDETVDREALAEFLGLVKRYCESEAAMETKPFMTYLQGRADTYYFSTGDTELMLSNVFTLGIYPSAAEMRDGKIIGNHGICFTNGLLGINALSAKKELADTYVRFAFSYEIQRREVDLSGYPIHTDVLAEAAKEDGSQRILASGDMSWRYYTPEESAWMVEQIKEVRTPFTRDESIWEIIRDAAEPYLKDAKSLDECVEEIASRIQLYLYEQ